MTSAMTMLPSLRSKSQDAEDENNHIMEALYHKDISETPTKLSYGSIIDKVYQGAHSISHMLEEGKHDDSKEQDFEDRNPISTEGQSDSTSLRSNVFLLLDEAQRIAVPIPEIPKKFHHDNDDIEDQSYPIEPEIYNYQEESKQDEYKVLSTATETDSLLPTKTVSVEQEETLTTTKTPICLRGFKVPGWDAYNRNLDERPVITKACTSLTGWFVGDFVTQTVIESSTPFDLHRSITLASFGFFFHGPVGHFLYNGIDELIVGNSAKHVTLKILVDQILWCPVFMVCYFTYLGLANGDTIFMILEKIHADIFIAILGSWKLWPLAHSINFRFVKTKHRIVYINCLEVCFIMFLSFLGNQ